MDVQSACLVCSRPHDIWKCNKFKGFTYEEKRTVVQSCGLCNKCLVKGHIAKECPKVNFKCQSPGCGGNHHTLMHRSTTGNGRVLDPGNSQGNTGSQNSSNSVGNATADQRSQLPSQVTAVPRNVTGAGNGNGIAVAATGAGESRVCHGIIPVKIRGKSNNRMIKTYALLDSGSEVTLCHELLANKLELDGERHNFTLTGMTGSTLVESNLVDLVVMSMDESVAVELLNVKTVDQMPISSSCIPKPEDLARWPHLEDIDIPVLRDGEVMLLIGFKERPSLFLPLEFKAGGDNEPIAVRYSLGWTVMGPMGESPLFSELCSSGR